MYQAHLFITGSVQGVNFRYFVKRSAKENGVTGWVKNVDDGRVEAILQGDKKAIETVIALCKKGPMLAEVRGVKVEWEKAGEIYEDFTVLTS